MGHGLVNGHWMGHGMEHGIEGCPRTLYGAKCVREHGMEHERSPVGRRVGDVLNATILCCLHLPRTLIHDASLLDSDPHRAGTWPAPDNLAYAAQSGRWTAVLSGDPQPRIRVVRMCARRNSSSRGSGRVGMHGAHCWDVHLRHRYAGMVLHRGGT